MSASGIKLELTSPIEAVVNVVTPLTANELKVPTDVMFVCATVDKVPARVAADIVPLELILPEDVI